MMLRNIRYRDHGSGDKSETMEYMQHQCNGCLRSVGPSDLENFLLLGFQYMIDIFDVTVGAFLDFVDAAF
jgi:hypothetical protein